MGKKSKAKKPKASAQEKALAQVATEKFAIYERLYRPLSKDRLDNDRATKARKDEAKGLVNADLRMKNKGKFGAIAARGLARGLQLGDARVQSEQSANDVAQRSVRGHASAMAVEGVEATERGTELAHVKLGHGLASQSQASMADQASSATSKAIQSAQNSLDKSMAFSESLGQVAGGVYGMGGFDGLGASAPARPQFGTYQLDAGGRSMR